MYARRMLKLIFLDWLALYSRCGRQDDGFQGAVQHSNVLCPLLNTVPRETAGEMLDPQLRIVDIGIEVPGI